MDIKFKCKYEGLKAKNQRKTGPYKNYPKDTVQVGQHTPATPALETLM